MTKIRRNLLMPEAATTFGFTNPARLIGEGTEEKEVQCRMWQTQCHSESRITASTRMKSCEKSSSS